MEELKPCPFCGSRAVVCLHDYEIDDSYEETDELSYAVVCDYTESGCGATGGYRKTKREAIEAWNRRVQNAN